MIKIFKRNLTKYSKRLSSQFGTIQKLKFQFSNLKAWAPIIVLRANWKKILKEKLF